MSSTMIAALPKARADVVTHMFAKVAVFADLTAADADWAALEAIAPISAYQTRSWAHAWMAHNGAVQKLQPMIVVAYEPGGQPILLLPLCVTRSGGLNVARFIGGKDANFNLPLARSGQEWDAPMLMQLLKQARRQAGAQPDIYLLSNQPEVWEGEANPLAALPRQASPSFGYKTKLVSDGDAMVRAKLSKDTRGKLARKERRLAEQGALRYFEAENGAQVERIVEAFIAQKTARFAAMGIKGLFNSLAERSFFLDASRRGAPTPPAIRWFGLQSGERIVATYAGAVYRGRFHGMVSSFDMAREVAISSPGELLLKWLVTRCCEQGLHTFDLGVGEAGYKNQWCDIAEPLFDSVIPVSLIGRAGSTFEAARLAAKRGIKQNDWLWRLARRLRALRARI